MNHASRAGFVVLLGVLFLAPSAVAEIYRWTDAQGRVHFGDRPRNEGAQRLEVESRPSSPPEGRSPEDGQVDQQRLIDALRDEREARELRQKKARADEARRSQRCAYARNRLQRYRSSRLYEPQEDGGKRYLTREQRQLEIEQTQAEVERWCGQ